MATKNIELIEAFMTRGVVYDKIRKKKPITELRLR